MLKNISTVKFKVCSYGMVMTVLLIVASTVSGIRNEARLSYQYHNIPLRTL